MQGLSIDQVAGKEELKQVVGIINLLYRLLKMMAKQSLVNSRLLWQYLDIFRSQLGKVMTDTDRHRVLKFWQAARATEGGSLVLFR